LEQKKDFKKSTVHDEAVRRVHGAKTLEEFQHIQKKADKVEELKSFGLTDAEIEYKLKEDYEVALCL
jgi:hypothetical protein